MKNKNIVHLAALCIIAALLLLTIFVPQITFAESVPVNITVIMRENDEKLLSNIKLGMESAAQELGGELEIIHPTVSNRHEIQIELIQNAIESKADAIVLQPADSELIKEYFLQNPTSVPVVFIEFASDNTYVGPNNEEIGKLLAQGALTATEQQIILLKTSEQSQAINMRFESCYNELLNANRQITVLRCDTSTMYIKLPAMLQKTGAKTVIAFEQSATKDMFLTSMDSGIKELNLYGIGLEGDVIQGMEQKHVAGVVVWNEYAQGYTATQIAISKIKADPNLLPESEQIPFKLIRGNEIYEKENERLLFPVF